MLETIAAECRKLEFVCSAAVIDGELQIKVTSGSNTFRLRLILGPKFPEELPQIRLDSADQYGHLPHVCWKGIVCYNDGEGLSINVERPVDVAIYALQQAVAVLPKSSVVNLSEFYDEYEGYWNQQSGTKSCQLFFEPGNRVSEIRIHQNKKGIPVSMLSSKKDENPSPDYSYSNGLNYKKTEVRGYYLPLVEAVAPPLPGHQVDTTFLDEVVAALDERNQIEWQTIVEKGNLPKRLTLLIAQPRPSVGQSLIGVTLAAPALRSWLNRSQKPSAITPLVIRRHTKNYLLNRGGIGDSPKNKKIAIVGCGALGCRIAELCLMSGITSLTLADGQVLSEENTFRHILGSEHIGVNKAEALKKVFHSRFPGVTVSVVPDEIAGVSELLAEHDVVVIAIGNPTLERKFSRQHRESISASTASITTAWLEASGVGGHSVLSDGASTGCLHCLYHSDNTPRLSSLTSFVEPGQIVTKNLTGCGGSFVPYSAVHAVKTATMVVEQIVQYLIDRDSKTTYVYWSSDINSNPASLKMTRWFYESLERGAESNILPVFDQGCPICRM